MKTETGFLSAVLVIIIVSLLASAATADVVLREKYPTEGENTELFIQADDGTPVSGAAVTVVYRPGSSVEATEAVGTTGPSGRLAWTPQTAGIASVNAVWDGGDTSANVSVKFGGAPAGGLIIMVLAGLLLVGGSVVRIMRVLRTE
jgi:hypothetical protein